MKLVVVRWVDSHKTDGWQVKQADCKALEIVSVGWIIAKSKDAITIAAHKSEEETQQYCNAMTIPRKSIIVIISVAQID